MVTNTRKEVRKVKMAWIRTICLQRARGLLREQYDTALQRAGKIFNIVSISSQRPEYIRDSMAFYTTLMHGPGSLTRAQREMLAVVVSRANSCFY